MRLLGREECIIWVEKSKGVLFKCIVIIVESVTLKLTVGRMCIAEFTRINRKPWI